MGKTRRPTLDESLRPMKMICIKCSGKLMCYPKEGVGQDSSTNYCQTCSPAWLDSFGKYLMNAYRKKRGLDPLA